MTDVSVLVPLDSDGAERDAAWRFLEDRYRRLRPDWELVTHPDPIAGAWSKGRAVNAAARAASGEVLVVADADVLIDVEVLDVSVQKVVAGEAAWVVPHGTVYRLDRDRTCEVLDGRRPAVPVELERRILARRPYEGPAGGGLVVVPRDAFELVGGIDERFLGWGGEDVSFARALETLHGPYERLGAPLWHLWHRPQHRPGGRAPVANDRLSGLYKAASGVPRLMRALVAHADPERIPPLGVPVRFEAPGKASVRAAGLKIRFGGGTVFETSDPDVVEALRRNPEVIEVP